MAEKIRGILFDLGDTLLDFGRVDVPMMFESGGRLAYQRLKDLGKAVPSFEKFHRRQLRAIRWNYFKSTLSGREFNSLDILGKLSEEMGHDLTSEQTQELAWLWYEPLSEQAKVEPGTADMLREFRSRGLSLGLVSNTFVPSSVLDRHLASLGLLELLPVRVYSCDVRYRKPHRKIFQLAMQRLGIPASETLFVGDSPKADIFGANRMGLVTVLKDPSEAHKDGKIQPQFTIRRLSELRQVLAQCETK
jgi:HAD superfamily hydrolase (TIGR01509 family)